MSLPPPSPLPPAPPPPPPHFTAAPAAVRSPIGGLAKTLQILLIAFVGMAVLTAPVSVATARRAHDFLAGTQGADGYEETQGIQTLLGALSSAVTVAIGVLTMIWMFRMARNHQSMGRHGMTWAPGWAIGGWFCPPMLYVIPFLMFRELWRASDPTVPPFDQRWASGRVGPLPTVWFVAYGILPLFGAGLTLSRFTLDFTRSNSTRAQARLADAPIWQPITISLITIVGALSFLALVRELTARHRRLMGEG